MKKCVRYTSIYCGVLWVRTDGRNSKFLLSWHQLRASAATRAAWRGWGQWQRRSPARVGVVTRSVWPLSSIKDSFYLRDAMVTRYLLSPRVCLSVRLSITSRHVPK